MSSELRRLVAALTVAHHIPGRIRLKLSGMAVGGGDVAPQTIVATLSAVDGVTSVAVNPLARSCTIEYDTAKISPRAWTTLVERAPSGDWASGEAADLIDRLSQVLPRAAQ